MTHPLVAKVYRSLLARAVVLSLSILIVLGVVTGALPVSCIATGDTICAPDSRLVAPDRATTNIATTNSLPQDGANALMVAELQSPPTLTHNDLIAATFSVLKVQMQPPADITNLGAGETPATRIVRTTPIRASLPMAPVAAPDPATGAAATVPDTTPKKNPVLVADATPAPTESIAPPAPETATPEPPTADPAPVADNNASGSAGVVAGKGANVRSSPVKGDGNVLFALRGGARVTIAERSKGWLKIIDDQGRSGWIYGSYVVQGGA